MKKLGRLLLLFVFSIFAVGFVLNLLAIALLSGPPPSGLIGGWTLVFSIILTWYFNRNYDRYFEPLD